MVNKLDYVMKKIVVKKNNLDGVFAQYPTKRKIRRSQQNNLLTALKDGKSFPVMYANRASQLSRKYVVLDGNHRLEALRNYFEQFPDAKVELNIGLYNIPDPQEERDKFLELNNIVKPSSDDIIQQYKEELPFLIGLLKIDGISIYGSNSHPLKVRNLVHAYIHAINPKWRPSIVSGKDMVAHMETFNANDLKTIRTFLKEYQTIYGILTKDSLYLKTTVLQIMLRLWYQNKERVAFNKMQQKFRSLMNQSILIEASTKGGNTVCMEYGDKFIDFLNRTGRNYDFILEQPEIPVPVPTPTPLPI